MTELRDYGKGKDEGKASLVLFFSTPCGLFFFLASLQLPLDSLEPLLLFFFFTPSDRFLASLQFPLVFLEPPSCSFFLSTTPDLFFFFFGIPPVPLGLFGAPLVFCFFHTFWSFFWHLSRSFGLKHPSSSRYFIDLSSDLNGVSMICLLRWQHDLCRFLSGRLGI